MLSLYGRAAPRLHSACHRAGRKEKRVGRWAPFCVALFRHLKAQTGRTRGTAAAVSRVFRLRQSWQPGWHARAHSSHHYHLSSLSGIRHRVSPLYTYLALRAWANAARCKKRAACAPHLETPYMPLRRRRSTTFSILRRDIRYLLWFSGVVILYLACNTFLAVILCGYCTVRLVYGCRYPFYHPVLRLFCAAHTTHACLPAAFRTWLYAPAARYTLPFAAYRNDSPRTLPPHTHILRTTFAFTATGSAMHHYVSTSARTTQPLRLLPRSGKLSMADTRGVAA